MRPKNEDVRKAILAAATELFAKGGYVTTTMSGIARKGGMSTANLYVYYKSKLAIMLEIYEPWLKQQILELEERVAAQGNTHDKILCLVRGILDDIPNDKEGYTRALVQALSISGPPEDYSPDLLRWVEERILSILSGIDRLDRSGLDLHAVAYMLMLIFDGVGLRRDLPPQPVLSSAMQEALVSMLLAHANLADAGSAARHASELAK